MNTKASSLIGIVAVLCAVAFLYRDQIKQCVRVELDLDAQAIHEATNVLAAGNHE